MIPYFHTGSYNASPLTLLENGAGVVNVAPKWGWKNRGFEDFDPKNRKRENRGPEGNLISAVQVGNIFRHVL